MPLIKPFAALRPVPEYAKDVVAPPYDVLSSSEARESASGKPWSFLHISKAEIDLPEDTDPHDPAVYARSAENFQKMRDEGILIRENRDCYYVYRITMSGHTQTGLVAVVSVAEYDKNRVRKHELTQPVKEDDRVRQIKALNAQTGPALLAYKSNTKMDEILKQVATGDPLVDVTTGDGVQHTFWSVCDDETIKKLSAGFEAMNAIYIADGHHRSASASRVAKSIKGNGDQNSDYFLTVIYPHNQMKILDYNRVVKDLNNMSNEEFIKKIHQSFEVEQEENAVSPNNSGEFGLYLQGQWYRLKIHQNLVPTDPVLKLDVSLLANNILDPLLDIKDPRTDTRIDFVGGIRGLGELEKRVDSGEMKIAFSMYPTSMEDLMAVADANEVMPPKSTWFEPKLADGLVSHVLD